MRHRKVENKITNNSKRMDKRINVNKLNSPNLKRRLRLEGTLHLKETKLIPQKVTSIRSVLMCLLNKALEQ